MNMNNLMNDFLSTGIPTFALSNDKKNVPANSTGAGIKGKDFREVLKSTIVQDKSAPSKPNQNFFNRNTVKVQDSVKKIDITSNEGKEVTTIDLDEKDREVINKTAQILGMEAAVLTGLFAAINVSMPELAGEMPVETLVDQIGMAAGLDAEQKSLLGEVILSARQAVSEGAAVFTAAHVSQEKPQSGTALEVNDLNSIVNAKNSEKSSATDASNTAAETPAQTIEGKRPENLHITEPAAEKEKLPEVKNLVSKLQEYTDAVEQPKEQDNHLEKSSDVKVFSDKAADDLNAAEETNTDAAGASSLITGQKPAQIKTQGNLVPAASDKPAEEAAVSVDISMQNNGHGGADESSQEALGWSRKIEAFKEVSAKTEGGKSENEIFQGILTPQFDAETTKSYRADSVQRNIPVSKEEVLSQIVEKAKVIIDGGKSEMIMELKPESLGKLSLKIIHERGMILAKFTAESEQVKQVLETNMQLLKDVLQRQGLAVQGFDVSVGQDASARQQAFQGGNRRRTENLQNSAVSSLTAADQIQDVRTSRYNWPQSSINLTA